jgi:hypothetical protein
MFSAFSSAFTPAWDSKIASEAAMDRAAPRRDLGQKKTLLLGGVNRKRSR